MTQHWKEQWHKRQETHLRRKQISHRHKVISPPSRENAAKTKSNSEKPLTPSPPLPLHLLSISSENSQKFLPRKQGDEYGAPKAPIISTYNKSAATSDQDHSLRSHPAQGKACTRCDADQSLGGDKDLTLQKLPQLVSSWCHGRGSWSQGMGALIAEWEEYKEAKPSMSSGEYYRGRQSLDYQRQHLLQTASKEQDTKYGRASGTVAQAQSHKSLPQGSTSDDFGANGKVFRGSGEPLYDNVVRQPLRKEQKPRNGGSHHFQLGESTNKEYLDPHIGQPTIRPSKDYHFHSNPINLSPMHYAALENN